MLLFFYLFFTIVSFASAEPPKDNDINDLILSGEERRVLQNVKSKVLPYISEDFMKSDFYLIRFIRSADLDVDGAIHLILQNVRWRQQNNISTILHKDLSPMLNDYPMSFYGGRDKKGRPFGTIELGEWDLRKAVEEGKVRKVDHFLIYALERALQELLRAQKETKKPITKMLVLVDDKGGSATKHLCEQCLNTFSRWLQNMDSNYPQFLKEIILINASPLVYERMKTLRQLMPSQTQRIFKLFDEDKAKWMPYLDERIDKHQRTRRYGGTRPEEVPQHFHGAIYKNDFVLEE